MNEKKKKLTLLTLVSQATEIVIDGHTFKKDERGWQIWFDSTELIYQTLSVKTIDRTSYKIGTRYLLPKFNPLEIFHCSSLLIAFKVALALANELREKHCKDCLHYSNEENKLLINPHEEFCRSAEVNQANDKFSTSKEAPKTVATQIDFARKHFCVNAIFFEPKESDGN